MANPYTTAQTAIESRFSNQWASTTPISWQNLTYTPVAGTAFVFFEVLFEGVVQASLGHPSSAVKRYDGTINLHVFAPVNQGTQPALTLAEQAAAIFSLQRFSGVRCQAAGIGQPEEGDDDGTWWRITVSCPFVYDDI